MSLRAWAALLLMSLVVPTANHTPSPAAAAACRPLSGYVQERPPEILRDRAGGEVIHNPPTPGQYPGVLLTLHGHTYLVLWRLQARQWTHSRWPLGKPLSSTLLSLVASGQAAAVRVCVAPRTGSVVVQGFSAVHGALGNALREAGYGITVVNPASLRPGGTVAVRVQNDGLVADLFHLAAAHHDSRWELFPVRAHGLQGVPTPLTLADSRPGSGFVWYRLRVPATAAAGTYGVWIALPASLGGATIYAGFTVSVR
jgi:hypothetical protein